jgi:hypothetical protein
MAWYIAYIPKLEKKKGRLMISVTLLSVPVSACVFVFSFIFLSRLIKLLPSPSMRPQFFVFCPLRVMSRKVMRLPCCLSVSPYLFLWFPVLSVSYACSSSHNFLLFNPIDMETCTQPVLTFFLLRFFH